MSSDQEIPSMVTHAIESIISNDIDTAKSTIRSIDERALIEERKALKHSVALVRKNWGGVYDESAIRQDLSSSKKKEIYARDSYVCCYCQRQTIDLDVLRKLSSIMPDVLPYHPSWKVGFCHPIYWVFSASLEHVKPVADGGTNDDSNLKTACYLCNDKKNDLPLGALGWDIHETNEKYLHWDGLTSYLEQLGKVTPEIKVNTPVGESGVKMSSDTESTGVLTIGSLVRMKLPTNAKRRQYKVELNSSNQIVLREMWQEDAGKKWVASKKTNALLVSSISDCSVISESAPDVES